MSILSKLWETPPNHLLSQHQENLDIDNVNIDQVPVGVKTSDLMTDTAEFKDSMLSEPASDSNQQSNGTQFFLDEMILLGKINTIHPGDVPESTIEPDQQSAAMIYQQTRDTTDPETHLVRPSGYLESVPVSVNLLGVPGDIDT